MRKKKVGIITFHTAVNYGVHLQAFSLVHIIKNLGYVPEVIDYRKKTEEVQVKFKKILGWLTGFNKIISNKAYNKGKLQIARRAEFERFDKTYLKLSLYCDNSEDVKNLSKDYDAVICGSDQIWNPYHTHGNGVFFCESVPSHKRIAYAPSFGIKELPEGYIEIYTHLIGEIKFISVREEAGRKIVKKITGKDAVVVVDPTLLVSKQVWKKLASGPNEKMCYENYVLCYLLGEQKYIDTIVEYWSLKGVKVINISQHKREYKSSDVIELYPSIEEFLYLFENANFIYTDSYHGVMFSLINEKDFYVFSRRDTLMDLNSRIENVLIKLDLMDRVVSNIAEIIVEEAHINYQDVNKIMKNWIDESIKYLKDSLYSVCGE